MNRHLIWDGDDAPIWNRQEALAPSYESRISEASWTDSAALLSRQNHRGGGLDGSGSSARSRGRFFSVARHVVCLSAALLLALWCLLWQAGYRPGRLAVMDRSGIAQKNDPCYESKDAPCPGQARSKKEACHTAVKGEPCYQAITWAKKTGIQLHPEWYEDLTSESSLVDFQAHMHAVNQGGGMCSSPCQVAEESEARACYTAVEGDPCYNAVDWAMSFGIMLHPDWYEGLTSDSSFEDFQSHLHMTKEGGGVCEAPCKGEKSPSLRASSRTSTTRTDTATHTRTTLRTTLMASSSTVTKARTAAPTTATRTITRTDTTLTWTATVTTTTKQPKEDHQGPWTWRWPAFPSMDLGGSRQVPTTTTTRTSTTLATLPSTVTRTTVTRTVTSVRKTTATATKTGTTTPKSTSTATRSTTETSATSTETETTSATTATVTEPASTTTTETRSTSTETSTTTGTTATETTATTTVKTTTEETTTKAPEEHLSHMERKVMKALAERREESMKKYPVKLFCFAVMVPWGDEKALLANAHKMSAGIFACEETTVYSSEEVAIAPGVTTIVARDSLKCDYGGEFKTALNNDIFMDIWKKVVADKVYSRCDWSIKVDPDSVFFPDRLRKRLAPWKPTADKKPVYINNCKLGMHGPFEVLSTKAVQLWFHGMDGCVTYFVKLCSGDCLWGEDMFLDQCFQRVLHVKRVNIYDILLEAHCFPPKGWDDCRHEDTVAFHPYKNPGNFTACLQRAVLR